MRSVIFWLLFINISIFLVKNYKNDPILVKSNRDDRVINYEKSLIVRDYYKNRLEKLLEIKNLVANKELDEILMLYKVSELDLELKTLELEE